MLAKRLAVVSMLPGLRAVVIVACFTSSLEAAIDGTMGKHCLQAQTWTNGGRALVVPIGRSGGRAEVVDESREAWRMLANVEATPGLVAEAVSKIVALRLVGV